MSTRLLTALLCATLALTACSAKGTALPNKHIQQDGLLKVHPGLLEAKPAQEMPAVEGKPAADSVQEKSGR